MVVCGHALNKVLLMHTMQYAMYIWPVLYVIITLGVMVVSGHAFNKVQLMWCCAVWVTYIVGVMYHF
jgi:hypothetical protein